MELKVLLVEDEPIARLVNTRLLEDLGYKPDIATTGEEAVKMANANYDIILMDIGLPGINGLEATSQIRSLEEANGHKAKIIALTAYSICEYKDRCVNSGMNGIENKPVSLDRLKSLLSTVI